MFYIFQPTRNGGRLSDADDVTVFQTPSKGLIDGQKYRWVEPASPSKGLPSSHRDSKCFTSISYKSKELF